MKHTPTRLGALSTLVLLALAASSVCAQDEDGGPKYPARNGKPRVNPVEESPLPHYAQGGVVRNGIAYFTSDPGGNLPGRPWRDEEFDYVMGFDAQTLRKVRSYDFRNTYDSAPYVFQKKDGTWLVAAHEEENSRTVARRVDNDKVEWISPANQKVTIYFGASTFFRMDRSQILYVACSNGLHAISGENGQELWSIAGSSYGGTTPCVDQTNGWVFYQNDGNLYKLAAETGKVLVHLEVPHPNVCSSFNTVLANSPQGSYVLTRWHTDATKNAQWDCGIRVYDLNLKLVWEKSGLPYGKKATITYWDGKMLIGTGNHWGKKYLNTDPKWKKLTAYNVKDGSVAWECDLSDLTYISIFNAPYYNGCIYAEVENSPHSYLVRIRGSDGKRMEVLTYDHRVSSCAPCIIACGKVLSGNLSQDRVVVTKIAENSKFDWPGVFCDPQTNTYALPDEPGAVLAPMAEIGGVHPNAGTN
jgi:outer membrane protein assembly factor BamB